jgi:hypothetical protein
MDVIERQFAELRSHYPAATRSSVAGGAILIEIPGFIMPPGWNTNKANVIFLLPPGYPSAQPDCFWLEPAPIRLENGATPQASNDSNPVPGVGPRGTWFSWHLQSWNPNRDQILTYVNVIEQRLSPAR